MEYKHFIQIEVTALKSLSTHHDEKRNSSREKKPLLDIDKRIESLLIPHPPYKLSQEDGIMYRLNSQEENVEIIYNFSHSISHQGRVTELFQQF